MVNRDTVIETHELTKSYGGFEAVKSASFKVNGPGITGFLGRNGAGKSSTIKMLLGMIMPTSGTGRVLGYQSDDAQQSLLIRQRVAYVGEDKGLYPYLTVKELIGFTRSFYPDWRLDMEERLLKNYQLPPHRKVRALSKGMHTKLALLLALSRRPALLVLDQPTEGLDPVSIEELLQTLTGITADGTAIFFSSYQLSEVERIADSILIIDRGRLMHLSEHLRRLCAGNVSHFALVLGLGGLQRERAHGCAGFTLPLPVRRSRLMAVRMMVGLVGIVMLSLFPAVLIPALSRCIGESYPFSQSLPFCVLWVSIGSAVFAFSLLVSAIFESEYTALAISIVAFFIYPLAVRLP